MAIQKITAEDLHEKMKKKEKFHLLDVRAEEKYQNYHITDSQNIPKTLVFEGDDLVSSLPKDEEIIVTCTTGNSAAKCAEILDRLDYNVVVLEGGITAWKEYKKVQQEENK